MAKKAVFAGIHDLILVTRATATEAAQAFRVGGLQEVGLKYEASEKELEGQLDFADDVFVSGRKITGTCKYAHIQGALLSKIIFPGSVEVSGELLYAKNELGNATTANQFTVANAGTFVQDYGVQYAVGTPKFNRLKRVLAAATPGTGEYKVAAGVYDFGSSDTDADAGVFISYTYRGVSGKSVKIVAQPSGELPDFQLLLSNLYKGNRRIHTLNRVVFKSTDWMAKNKDHAVPNLEFSAYPDDIDEVGEISTSVHE